MYYKVQNRENVMDISNKKDDRYFGNLLYHLALKKVKKGKRNFYDALMWQVNDFDRSPKKLQKFNAYLIRVKNKAAYIPFSAKKLYVAVMESLED